MKLIILFMTTVSILGCQKTKEETINAGSQTSYNYASTPSKWSRAFPLNLTISNDFDANEIQAMNSAANSWGQGSGKTNQFFNVSNSLLDTKSSLGSYNDGTLGIYKIHQWPSELPATALAVTQINGTQNSSYININHADILLNYDYFSFSTDGGWGYDLETVVLHEMGHFLGLYHTGKSSDDTVMYPTISRYTINKKPKTSDLQALSRKYSTTIQALQVENTNQDKDITIILEMYPDKEIMKIGDKEILLEH